MFRTVALTGNGSAAALALSVSKPAISKSLSVLEQVCLCLPFMCCVIAAELNVPAQQRQSFSGATPAIQNLLLVVD